ncbi:MAG: hypothetical protein OER88_03230 [Planctomycetota bacterium]|nr:hypothetical protein [Planctomycetota bacterium]
MRTLALALVAGGFLGMIAPSADACWDNTDAVVFKLKRLSLSTTQLKEIFTLHKEHKAVVTRAHREGLGCRVHEDHDAVFVKQAIGVLTNKQFKAYTGRIRTKVETLEYDNRQLKKELAQQRAELAKLRAEVKRLKAELAKKTAK